MTAQVRFNTAFALDSVESGLHRGFWKASLMVRKLPVSKVYVFIDNSTQRWAGLQYPR